MGKPSPQVILRRARYWTRTVALHDAAHIIDSRSRGGVVRYFLACGNSVTGGRVVTYDRIQKLRAHVCIGCTDKAVGA